MACYAIIVAHELLGDGWWRRSPWHQTPSFFLLSPPPLIEPTLSPEGDANALNQGDQLIADETFLFQIQIKISH